MFNHIAKTKQWTENQYTLIKLKDLRIVQLFGPLKQWKWNFEWSHRTKQPYISHTKISKGICICSQLIDVRFDFYVLLRVSASNVHMAYSVERFAIIFIIIKLYLLYFRPTYQDAKVAYIA